MIENDLSELLRAVLYQRPYAVRASNVTLRIALTMGLVSRRTAPPPSNLLDAWVLLGRDLTLTEAGLEELQAPDEEP